MVFPKKTQGMNRQMYVEGNPMMWRDVSGNSTNYVHMFKMDQVLEVLEGL